jgi:hypothetical protein
MKWSPNHGLHRARSDGRPPLKPGLDLSALLIKKQGVTAVGKPKDGISCQSLVVEDTPSKP